MFDERYVISIVAGTTQQQCREIGELFLRLAQMPRQTSFRALIRGKLARLPKFDRAAVIDAGRREVARRADEEFRMRETLRKIGYEPAPDTIPEPSFDELKAWRDRRRRPAPGEPDASTYREASILEVIGQTTQAECREIGELFASLVDVPRDAAWDAAMKARIDALPRPEIEVLMEAGERRVIEGCDMPLWRTGWHPIQMRRELRERGHIIEGAEA